MSASFITMMCILLLSVYVLQWIDSIIYRISKYKNGYVLNVVAGTAITYLFYNYVLTF